MDNIIGKRFNHLLVVKFSHLHYCGKYKYRYYTCLCDCGNICTKSGSSVRVGHTKSCGCLHKESARKTGKNNANAPRSASFNIIYKNYMRQAERRNLVFQLSPIEFKEITSRCCYYCGELPAETGTYHDIRYNGTYTYNGIDRVNSELGYTIDNVVACCKICNFMKGTLSITDFINQISKIHKTLSKVSVKI